MRPLQVMASTTPTQPASPTLQTFVLPLLVEERELFAPHTHGPLTRSAYRTEEQVQFLFSNEAVRVWAPRILGLRGRGSDADTLRALEPIKDKASALAALAAIDTFKAREGLLHIKDAAHCVSGREPAFVADVGKRAAHVVVQLASCYAGAGDKRAVYEEAASFLAELQHGGQPSFGAEART